MKENIKKIDTINIMLMVFSFLLARVFPFELFLFSYIVLGPLHYMTEISWLKERNFFVGKNTWLIVLLTIAIVGAASRIGLMGFEENMDFQRMMGPLVSLALLLGFVIAAISINKKLPILLGLAISMVFGVLFFMFRFSYLVFLLVLLIPTLIHTTIFTGSFMLEGALKNKSTIGYLAFLVFILCNVFFFILPTDAVPLTNQLTQKLFLESDFYQVNLNLNYLIFGTDGSTFVLDSSIGRQIQGFIAFAYTYHYLNWFSKTKVIKWTQVPKPWLFASVTVWILSIVLHLINMKIGIAFIAFLSTLHVYLEFPLNHKSFVNVGSMLFGFKRSDSVSVNG
ncbi:MAG: hypothetical protein KDC49_20240 [Saprospiraceae bacterium]|nr:hypothetical protein [Saprospiraceae bacterium]